VYVTRDEVEQQMRAGGGHLGTTLGTVGESVLVAATQCQGSIFAGAYPDLAFRGEVLPQLRRLTDSVERGSNSVC
jgi:hypothetical protein